MSALVTLEMARAHVRQPVADLDLQVKVNQASAIIVKYLKSQADPTWTEATVPLPVQAAILLMVAHLDQNRGDVMDQDEHVWNAINRQLVGYRDPALA